MNRNINLPSFSEIIVPRNLSRKSLLIIIQSSAELLWLICYFIEDYIVTVMTHTQFCDSILKDKISRLVAYKPEWLISKKYKWKVQNTVQWRLEC